MLTLAVKRSTDSNGGRGVGGGGKREVLSRWFHYAVPFGCNSCTPGTQPPDCSTHQYLVLDKYAGISQH